MKRDWDLAGFLRLGSISGVVVQARPPQQSDFGGGGLQSPIYINSLTGESWIYINGQIVPLTNASQINASISLMSGVHNAEFTIAQRGATYSPTTSIAYGSVDRWAFVQASPGNANANQVSATGKFTGFTQCLQLGRQVGAVQVGAIKAIEAFITAESVQYAGRQITLSFHALVGANFSGAGSTVTVKVKTGTGTDESVALFSSDSQAGAANAVNTSPVIGLTDQLVQVTFTMPSTVRQVAIEFSYTPVGTAGADDNVYITGVKLEAAAQASPWVTRPQPLSQAICNAFYLRINGGAPASGLSGGCWLSTTLFAGAIDYAPMRVAPTLSVSAAADIMVQGASGGTIAGTSIALTGATTTGARFDVTVASGGTNGGAGVILINSGKWIAVSADL